MDQAPAQAHVTGTRRNFGPWIYAQREAKGRWATEQEGGVFIGGSLEEGGEVGPCIWFGGKGALASVREHHDGAEAAAARGASPRLW